MFRKITYKSIDLSNYFLMVTMIVAGTKTMVVKPK